MADTKTPNEAFNYAKVFIRNMPLGDVQYDILDDVSRILWMAAPWRWTLGNLTNIPLIDSQSDYTQTVPADFLKIYDGWMIDSEGAAISLYVDAQSPTPVLPQGRTSSIAYVATNTFRLTPAPRLPRATTLVMRYKKIPPTISASNGNTAGALGIPDAYFPVYRMGVLAFAGYYALDARAGDIQLVEPAGQSQRTGWFSQFWAMVADLRLQEAIPIDRTTNKHDMVAPRKS